MVSRAYPNEMTAEASYDESGAAVRLVYTKTSNCSSDCVWVDERVVESVHGQWRSRDWELSSQDYSYDGAGRLIGVVDDVAEPAAVQGCTIRSYAFDANSNRLSLNSKAPAGNGDCQPGVVGATTGYGYDDADRLVGTGVSYDAFGRMKRVPGVHAGGEPVSYSYYVNDQVRSISQGGELSLFETDEFGNLRQPAGGRYGWLGGKARRTMADSGIIQMGVRSYIPALAVTAVPDAHLAEHWRMPDDLQRSCGCSIGRDYPAPIVDHPAARERALERYRV